METAALVNERIAKGQQLLEDAARAGEELSRSRTEAWQLFDDRKGEAAEARWDEARKAEARYRENLGQAARELEAAVALDPDREEARRLFAGTLFDRAVEAEERGALAERDDFLLRMSLYDDGTQQARWDAPGTLAVSAPVPGASVTLERYAADDKGKLHLESVSAPGELPFDGLSLPPGSYRLTVRAAGYEEVLYPVQLSRGEAVAVEVAPVPVGSVPEGFVYVPPGRFLFGSAQDDETRRGFHHTAPVHHRSTGAYLIARHETTFRQWLEYLEALPLDMREKRKPSVHAGGFEGALSVTELPGGGWRLSFKPTATAYAASSGEQIVYPGRSVRKAQDWLRFPVVGITSADAEAYAAWLDETGRLPGARLCTDLEWERAARGADGREYPHGNSLSPEEANFDNTYAKDPASMGPDEVGSHPRSRSPFGLDDMAGNVWEWTRSSLEEKGHAARGGSYYFDINTARTHNRETPEPSFRDASVGFRVCADVLSPAS